MRDSHPSSRGALARQGKDGPCPNWPDCWEGGEGQKSIYSKRNGYIPLFSFFFFFYRHRWIVDSAGHGQHDIAPKRNFFWFYLFFFAKSTWQLGNREKQGEGVMAISTSCYGYMFFLFNKRNAYRPNTKSSAATTRPLFYFFLFSSAMAIVRDALPIYI